MQFFFVITGDGKPHTWLSLRTIVVYNTLTHVQGIHVQQVADISFYGLKSGCVCNFGNLNASTLGGKVQNHPLPVGQLAWLTFLKVGVNADGGLTFHLES